MKTVTINKVRVGSFAKVVGITQAVFAFVYGLVLSIAVASEAITPETSFVRGLGISIFVLGMAVLLLPLIAFIIGWIQGAFAALILNFVFAESKGLDFEVTESKQ
jgi:uncharacterized membrane protein